MPAQLSLLDVPADRPPLQLRIKALKAKHSIWTHRAARTEDPWCALWVPEDAKYGADEKPWRTWDPIELIAHYCRLLDEGGFLVCGPGEVAVIREVCRLNKLECDL